MYDDNNDIIDDTKNSGDDYIDGVDGEVSMTSQMLRALRVALMVVCG